VCVCGVCVCVRARAKRGECMDILLRVKATEETLAVNKYFRCTLTEEKVVVPFSFLQPAVPKSRKKQSF